MPASRAASSITKAPKTSVWMNSPGDSIERSTWDSAAKLTIASQPSIAAATASRSAMSPSTSSTPVRGEALEVLAPPRVGELVEHPDRVARVSGEAVAHVGRADEPGAARDQDPHARGLAALALGEVGGQALPPVRKRDRRRGARCRAPSRRAGAPCGPASRWSPPSPGTRRPAWSKISWANSYHEHCPPPARWWIPNVVALDQHRDAPRRGGACRSGSRPGPRRPAPRAARRRAAASSRRSSFPPSPNSHDGADDEVARVGDRDRGLARQLGAAVGRERRGDVGLDVGLARGAVEDVVARRVDDLGADARGGGGEQRRALVVDPHRAGLVVLGAVDVGEGGAVDDRVGRVPRRGPRSTAADVGDVEGGVGERHDLVVARAWQRAPSTSRPSMPRLGAGDAAIRSRDLDLRVVADDHPQGLGKPVAARERDVAARAGSPPCASRGRETLEPGEQDRVLDLGARRR